MTAVLLVVGYNYVISMCLDSKELSEIFSFIMQVKQEAII